MSAPTIGFMAPATWPTSLIGRMLSRTSNPVSDSWPATAPRRAGPKRLGKQFGISHHVRQTTNSPVNGDVLVLGVKPQVMQAVLARPWTVAARNPASLIISPFRSISLRQSGKLPGRWQAPSLRFACPTPRRCAARVSASGVCQCPRSLTRRSNRPKAISSMPWASACGWSAKELIDAVTAVSGSGRTYFFYMMEAYDPPPAITGWALPRDNRRAADAGSPPWALRHGPCTVDVERRRTAPRVWLPRAAPQSGDQQVLPKTTYLRIVTSGAPCKPPPHGARRNDKE